MALLQYLLKGCDAREIFLVFFYQVLNGVSTGDNFSLCYYYVVKGASSPLSLLFPFEKWFYKVEENLITEAYIYPCD